jgi:hypothetical protein
MSRRCDNPGSASRPPRLSRMIAAGRSDGFPNMPVAPVRQVHGPVRKRPEPMRGSCKTARRTDGQKSIWLHGGALKSHKTCEDTNDTNECATEKRGNYPIAGEDSGVADDKRCRDAAPGRAVDDPARCATRPSRPDRDQEGLRSRSMRRVHRAVGRTWCGALEWRCTRKRSSITSSAAS